MRDRHAEGRARGAARHHAGLALPGEDRVAVPGDPAAADDEADEATARPLGGDPLEGRPADEVAGLVELDHPAETGVVRADGRIEVVAVERHPRLEPERVARAQPDRHQPVRSAGVEQGVPQLDPPARSRRTPRSRPRRCSRSGRRARRSRPPGPRRSRSSAARRGRCRSAGRGCRASAGPGWRPGRSPGSGRRGSPGTRRSARPGGRSRAAHSRRWRRRGTAPRPAGRR